MNHTPIQTQGKDIEILIVWKKTMKMEKNGLEHMALVLSANTLKCSLICFLQNFSNMSFK